MMKPYLPPRQPPTAVVRIVIEVESAEDGKLEIYTWAIGPSNQGAFDTFKRQHPELKAVRFETPYEHLCGHRTPRGAQTEHAPQTPA